MTPPPNRGRRPRPGGGGSGRRRGGAPRHEGAGRTGGPPSSREAGGVRHRAPSERQLGGEQVEGRRAVRELLAAGLRRTRDVWLADTVDEHASVVAEIIDIASHAGVPVRRVARARLESVARSEAPQGVLAHADPLPEADLDALCRPLGGRPPFLVALDGVTDPHNLGAILRTAEVAGATGAVLPRHRSAHVTPTVAKAAAGAIEHLPMAVVSGLPAALAELARRRVWSVGLDVGADRRVYDLELATEPLVLVLGSEGSGLGRLTRDRCDVVVTIPQQGALPSLNVAAAAAVACFEVARRRDRF